MDKTYTVDDFTLKNIMFEENNSWSYFPDPAGKFAVNLSDILTFLIQRVGSFTKHYASDLFIDWKTVEKIVSTLPEEDHKNYKIMFGIREFGVDHDSFIISRLNSSENAIKEYIGGIYMMEIDIEKSNNIWGSPKMHIKFGEAEI